MTTLIQVEGLGKQYGKQGKGPALRDIDFVLEGGQILGLLGHNGAGKSTLIQALLGSVHYQGRIDIMGLEPLRDHAGLMRHMSYVSDVNSLPDWMKVQQLVNYMSGVHPDFSAAAAQQTLAATDIQPHMLVGSLSKGMKVQLHLALVMATDCRILILDEPTSGLDLMYRDTFYRQLLEWFDDGCGERSVIIASHEVSEIEHLLTHVLILKQGQMRLSSSLEALSEDYFILEAARQHDEQIRAFQPLAGEPGLGVCRWLLKAEYREKAGQMGQLTGVRLTDVFLALQKEAQA